MMFSIIRRSVCVVIISLGLSSTFAAEDQPALLTNVFAVNLERMLSRVHSGKNIRIDENSPVGTGVRNDWSMYCKHFIESIQSNVTGDIKLPTPLLSTALNGNAVIRDFLLEKGKLCKRANPLQRMDRWLFEGGLNKSNINVYENPQMPGFFVLMSAKQGPDSAHFGTDITVGSFYTQGTSDDLCFSFEDSGMFEDLKGVTLFKGKIMAYASGETDLQCETDNPCHSDLDISRKRFIRLYPPNHSWKGNTASSRLNNNTENVKWDMGYICTAYFD